MMYRTEYMAPVGRLTLIADEEALLGLWIQGQQYEDEAMWGAASILRETRILADACGWLDRYFAGEKPVPGELPLHPQGNAFRQMIWEMLCRIPYGQVTTYGALARAAASRMGKERMAAQAVGGAVGHNPISIIIPCHRVVASDGKLTGYAGGLDKKRMLLTREGISLRNGRVQHAVFLGEEAFPETESVILSPLA